MVVRQRSCSSPSARARAWPHDLLRPMKWRWKNYASLQKGSVWLLLRDTAVLPAPAAGTVGARDMMEPLTAEVPEEGEVEQSSQPTHDAAWVGNDPLWPEAAFFFLTGVSLSLPNWCAQWPLNVKYPSRHSVYYCTGEESNAQSHGRNVARRLRDENIAKLRLLNVIQRGTQRK